MVITFIRLADVLKKRAKSRSAHYLDIQQGLFVVPVATGLRSVAYPVHEVDALNAACYAGKNDDEIRALVCDLHAQREGFAMEACVG